MKTKEGINSINNSLKIKSIFQVARNNLLQGNAVSLKVHNPNISPNLH